MKKQIDTNIILASNRKALHDYFIEEKYEAGIVLYSGELKSCIDKHINLSEGYITIDKGQLVLYNVHITKYKNDCNKKNYSETRVRTLLMHKKEILSIANKIKKEGITLIPLSFYINKDKLLKVEVALVKGKHNYDKRKALKEKELKKELKNI